MQNESIWEGTVERRSYPELTGEVRADVAVIGAGITGLTAAVLLKRAGKRVVVLEASRVGSGTSGHTTAHVSTLWDPGYDELGRKYGKSVAEQVASCLRGGLENIDRLATDLSIPCGFMRVPGYYYAERGQTKSVIEREFQAAKEAGLECTWVDRAPLPFPTSGGFVVQDQAQLHALDYLQGLAAAVDGDDCSVHEQSRISSMSFDPCRVRTDRATVIADRIILATHTPLGVNPIHTEVAPYRSYALAARVREEVPNALFWDAADPYHYLRTQVIGDATWLIAGGKDRKTAHGEETASFEALRQWVRDRFDVVEIGWDWSAQLYEPADHLPFIGRSPFTSNVYLATGFSGDGIPFGSAAGMILCDLLAGRGNEYAELFRPERLHVKSLPTFVKENADVMKSFLVDRLPGKDVDREAALLSPGQGRVVGRGPGKVAIYRSEEGAVSRFSAVCPHMKCIVRWNDAQRSFDCPCHGSRFSCDGSVIEGPALSGLTKLPD